MSAPGRADLPSANLTPAPGARTTRLHRPRKAPFVSAPFDRSQVLSTRPAITSRAQRCRVHHIPPRVRDDRDTPLLGDETARLIDVIWVKRERKSFWQWDWTGQIRLNRFNKSHSSGYKGGLRFANPPYALVPQAVCGMPSRKQGAQ